MLDYVRKSTTYRVVLIKTIPIYPSPEQYFRYMYYDTITNSFDIANSLLGVTGSSILHLCAKFGFYLLFRFFSICTNKRSRVKQLLWLWSIVVKNKLCAQNLYFLVIVSHQLFCTYGSMISVSDTMLLTPAMCWMLGLNYSIMSCQIITLWD